MGTGEFNAGVTLRWTSIPSRGEEEILLVASCYSNRDKLRPAGPFGSYAELKTFFFTSLLFYFMDLSFLFQERKTVSSAPGGLVEEVLKRQERTETDSGQPIVETITTRRTYTTSTTPDSGKYMSN